MRIAIDAMGGDHAPAVPIEGTLESARAHPNARFLLVGPEKEVRAELDRQGSVPPNVELRHAPQVIGMNEHPVEALRRKPDNTILRCVRLLVSGEADGMMSAGNTGAVVACAMLRMGLIEGVRRAGIMIPLPNDRGFSGLIDAGANLKASPINFLHYAVMASTYVGLVSGGTAPPSVGLLNVGEESRKGTWKLQQTYQLFRRFLGKRFIGNIEGHDLFTGRAQVVVCDGFVGNIVLKTGEGLTGYLLRSVLGNGFPESSRYVLERAVSRFDYSEYGGAPLLGVDGLVIIAHGRSSAKAIARAIDTTLSVAGRNLLGRMKQGLADFTLWRRFQKWFEEKWFDEKGKEE